MTKPYATVEQTKALTEARPELIYNRLGETGLHVSQAGFGCYRVAAGVRDHETALEAALEAGINLIDTSTNYADGESERMVGAVLEKMIGTGRRTRQEVIVVSKVGYLQGKNLELLQKRAARGRAFEDVVPYASQLAHCIHPQFVEDQLGRSLERLGLHTVDVYLLHNPEYYLGWAREQGIDRRDAESEYYSRIRRAFAHLESEADNGRIRYYGISSNTFPAAADEAQFTSLQRVWEIAESVSPRHHFAVVQMPMNLLETGGVLEVNQAGGHTALSFAADHGLAVLVNRPLNAFFNNRMIRLVDVETGGRSADSDIVRAIQYLYKSEAAFWRKLLPELPVPQPMKMRLKEQITVGEYLKHYWKNFGSFDRWRQVEGRFLLPRYEGVAQFLTQFEDTVEGLKAWLSEHTRKVHRALRAVRSVYAAEAIREIGRIQRRVRVSNPVWAEAPTMSQIALRALRSTPGISCVLVGMRRPPYVQDILAELKRPLTTGDPLSSWQRLQAETIQLAAETSS